MLYRLIINEDKGFPLECILLEYENFTIHQTVPIDILTCLGDLIASFTVTEFGYQKTQNIPLFLGYKITAREQPSYLSFEIDARNDALHYCEMQQPISIQLFDLACISCLVNFHPHVALLTGEKIGSQYITQTIKRFEPFDPTRNLQYSYECTDIWSVTYAIMHYLIHHEYSFVRCEHCGRYFATKNRRNKYCTRISPLSSTRTCKEEVENAAARCKAARNRIKQRLYKDGLALLDESKRQTYYDFLNMCDSLHSQVKKQASCENICSYENYLKTFKIRKRGRTTKE